ncbi:MAG: HlyD family efflux transporter periplasmic adaptor subunit [Clostridiaceae bacterium]
MSKRGKIITGILLLALIGAIAYYVVSSQKEVIKSVSIQIVDSGEISSNLLTTGKIISAKEKTYAGPNLLVKAIYVKVGQRVKAGELLFEYDTTDLQAAVKQAELQKDNAVLNKKQTETSIANSKNLKANLEKQQKTYQALIAESNAKKAEALKDPLNITNITIIAEESQKSTAYQTAAAQIQQSLASIPSVSASQLKLLDNTISSANLALETAQNRLNSATSSIMAEFDGIITEVNGTVNTIATMGINVLTMKDDKDLVVELSLGKFDATKVKIGQTATITYGDRTFSGEVVFINPAATTQGGSISALGAAGAATGESTLGVKVSIQNPVEIIMDFEADVEILLEKKENVIRIPIESIMYKDQGKPIVFVEKDGLLEEREVVVGLSSDNYLECLEGIKPGERIVLNPTDSLKAGEAVIAND